MNYKIILTALLLFFTTVNAQEKLTLEKSIEIALSNNTNLVKTKNSLSTYESSLKTAYGNLLPSLSVTGSWKWQKTETDKDLAGKQEDVEADTRNYSLSAGGDVTLFDGLSNLYTIDQKKNELASAQYNLEDLRQDVALQTTSYFYSALNAKEILAAKEENVKYNRELLQLIREKQELGIVPVADVYSQEVQLGTAELSQIQAENDFEKAKNQLLNFLSLKISDEYDLEGPVTNAENIDTTEINKYNNPDQLYSTALEQRKDFVSQQYQYESMLNSLSISKADQYPTLTGSYSVSSSASSTGNLFKERSYGVGLSLNIPVFSNFKTEYAIEAASVQAKNALEDLNNLRREIINEVKDSYIDLKLSIKSLNVSNATLKSAAETQKIKLEMYQVGSGTLLDVMQANKDYIQAVGDKITAQYNYYIAKEALLNAIGEEK
jgi:outer membrane protein